MIPYYLAMLIGLGFFVLGWFAAKVDFKQLSRKQKKYHYLHVSYKAQFDKFSWLESDRLMRLTSFSLNELRQSICNIVEKESLRKVETLMLTDFTELSEGLFNMLTKGESFTDLDPSKKA